jgi:SAM-dependent methyltransferase
MARPRTRRGQMRSIVRMTTEDWVPPGVDTKRANVARVYDYLLGGNHNFLADQDVARSIIAVEPNSRAIGRANRAFLGRAVRFLASSGIAQFLDIGSGIPTEGNVHEIAQQADPAARVVYADIDQVAVAHSKAILAMNPNTAVIEADLREPRDILASDTVASLIDFAQPVGLLLVAVLHFLADADDPWQIVATLRDALAPGSYLVLCHGTDEGKPVVARAAEKVYSHGVSSDIHMRSRAQIMRFFDGLQVVDPGLVPIPMWRPAPDAGAPSDSGEFWGGLAGVAYKP